MPMKYTCTGCQKIADHMSSIAKPLYECECGYQHLDRDHFYEFTVFNKHMSVHGERHYVCGSCRNKPLTEILKIKQKGEDNE